MHVTSLFGVVSFLASYDEYTALVKLVKLQVNTSGEQTVECISGGTWIL